MDQFLLPSVFCSLSTSSKVWLSFSCALPSRSICPSCVTVSSPYAVLPSCRRHPLVSCPVYMFGSRTALSALWLTHLYRSLVTFRANSETWLRLNQTSETVTSTWSVCSSAVLMEEHVLQSITLFIFDSAVGKVPKGKAWLPLDNIINVRGQHD